MNEIYLLSSVSNKLIQSANMLTIATTADTAINHFWSLVSGVLLLNAETFESINNLPLGLFASILVVLLAGLSQTFGQSVMLFVNRVRPLRFFFVDRHRSSTICL